ncbi:MAG: DUF1905 domain-containing protein [Sphingobacteriales bacterium]|nr:DUF1905 domain-containing protein [Sphingobacteriales bacterium]
MKFSFKARIYKVGINSCIKVPKNISNKLIAEKGYIPIKGTIEGFFFQQTLCPVRGEGYRLYVNGIMIKGGKVKNGQTARFIIEQDSWERNRNFPMLPAFRKELKKNKLLNTFLQLSASRQKEVNRYLNHLKTKEAQQRNIERMISVMKGRAISPLYK